MLARHLDVQFEVSEAKMTNILLEGVDVTDQIRTEKRGNAASKVSQYQGVRDALLARQRAFHHAPGLIAEGRDMGTVVFTEAPLKLYLVATSEERAKRRFKELKDKGVRVKIADLVEEIAERDRRDRERAVAPLRPADDAVIIDTTGLTISEVMLRVKTEVSERLDFEPDLQGV